MVNQFRWSVAPLVSMDLAFSRLESRKPFIAKTNGVWVYYCPPSAGQRTQMWAGFGMDFAASLEAFREYFARQ